ncbi:hypothetical protein ABEF95_014421 [Exophiala dermatitidis]
MKAKSVPEDSLQPTCTFVLLDCLSSETEDEDKRASTAPGVEREMRIMYQQPHLVPPMKLTVFDHLPPTPTPPSPSRISRWVSQGKDSLRSSLSTGRHVPSRPVISSPRPPADQQRPYHSMRQEFRPLELSIYMTDNRLPDLPEFDRLSFTDVGEIKSPPRAVVRTKSEELLSNKLSMMPTRVKPASMIEQRQRSRSQTRPDTTSTVISTSRPPSQYDALHSHPVSWASLPGLPPTAHIPGRSEPSVAILTPMEEEFSPPITSVTVGGLVLEFPKVVDQPGISPMQSAVGSPYTHAPAPIVASPPSRELSKPTETENTANFFHPDYQTQQRISHWLSHRQSSSISTTKTASTAAPSFSERRRKRAQFYQLSAAPPKPLSLCAAHHQRTLTGSTMASTLETDALTFEIQSQTDVSVATPTDSQIRNGTARSVSNGLKPIVSGVPYVPPDYADMLKQTDEVHIKEIGGPLRSPGVGVAF